MNLQRIPLEKMGQKIPSLIEKVPFPTVAIDRPDVTRLRGFECANQAESTPHQSRHGGRGRMRPMHVGEGVGIAPKPLALRQIIAGEIIPAGEQILIVPRWQHPKTCILQIFAPHPRQFLQMRQIPLRRTARGKAGRIDAIHLGKLRLRQFHGPRIDLQCRPGLPPGPAFTENTAINREIRRIHVHGPLIGPREHHQIR